MRFYGSANVALAALCVGVVAACSSSTSGAAGPATTGGRSASSPAAIQSPASTSRGTADSSSAKAGGTAGGPIARIEADCALSTADVASAIAPHLIPRAATHGLAVTATEPTGAALGGRCQYTVPGVLGVTGDQPVPVFSLVYYTNGQMAAIMRQKVTAGSVAVSRPAGAEDARQFNEARWFFYPDVAVELLVENSELWAVRVNPQFDQMCAAIDDQLQRAYERNLH